MSSSSTTARTIQATSAGHSFDSIATGLSFMLIANVLQRAIGFVRNLSFCRLLDQDNLGYWALASSFFILAAPLVVLGVPGTFGRLIEGYRVRMQLSAFLRRALLASTFSTLFFAALFLWGNPWLGTWIFGSPISTETMELVVVCLLTVIIFNTTTELLNGLRRSKIVSSMHSVNSISFTVLSLIGLWLWPDWRTIVATYAIASIIGLVPALLQRRVVSQVIHTSHELLPQWEMWRRVLPFAASIWLINLMTNLFDVVDRYMLLYVSPIGVDGVALIGQFHSARILPVLLTSLTMMLSSMLLPYLAADWEQGKRESVRESLQLTLKGAMICFFGFSIIAVTVAPTLFNHLLEGRYGGGLEIMPIALLHCCFAGVTALLQNYFWCIERGRVVGLVTLLGLLVNILLNFILVPVFTLHGAMAATAIAGAFILIMTMIALQLSHIRLDRSCIWFGLLPVSLVIHPVFAVCAASLVFILMSRTQHLLNSAEKRKLDQAILPSMKKLGIKIDSLWFV